VTIPAWLQEIEYQRDFWQDKEDLCKSIDCLLAIVRRYHEALEKIQVECHGLCFLDPDAQLGRISDMAKAAIAEERS